MRYFITGLPRSRTSWMANLMTTDNSFCFHEPVTELERHKSEISDMMDKKAIHYKNVGVSDSALPLYFEEVIKPGDNVVIIERDVDDVAVSISESMGISLKLGMEFAEEQWQKLEELKKALPLVLPIKYENLDDAGVTLAVMKFLTRDLYLDEDRVRRLINTNVQVDIKRYEKTFNPKKIYDILWQ